MGQKPKTKIAATGRGGGSKGSAKRRTSATVKAPQTVVDTLSSKLRRHTGASGSRPRPATGRSRADHPICETYSCDSDGIISVRLTRQKDGQSRSYEIFRD